MCDWQNVVLHKAPITTDTKLNTKTTIQRQELLVIVKSFVYTSIITCRESLLNYIMVPN